MWVWTLSFTRFKHLSELRPFVRLSSQLLDVNPHSQYLILSNLCNMFFSLCSDWGKWHLASAYHYLHGHVVTMPTCMWVMVFLSPAVAWRFIDNQPPLSPIDIIYIIYTSIHYLFCFEGSRGSCHWARGGVRPGQVTSESQDRHTDIYKTI